MIYKNKDSIAGDNQTQAARLYGNHVSKEKAWVLLIVTVIVCILPAITGIRCWHNIAEIVETGIIKMDGQDDSIPRSVLVFGIPGLLCVLNLIIHIKLYISQKKMILPKLFIRLFGRWGMPILSIFLANIFILRAAGQPFGLFLITCCFPGLAMLLLSSIIMDCSRDKSVILRFFFIREDSFVWNVTHKVAVYFWLLVGLSILAFTIITGVTSIYSIAVAFMMLPVPVLFGQLLSKWGQGINYQK